MAVDLTTSMIAATVEIEQAQAAGAKVVGTAFLVAAPRPDGTPRIVLVTAAHLLDDMAGTTARVGWRVQGPDGGWTYAPQPLTIRAGGKPLWTRSADRDVAVMAIQAPPEAARAAIPLAWLASGARMEASGVGPGDEMFLLGYPGGAAANEADFPILRAAFVASWPLTPVARVPTFLVDAHVSQGDSGGPVFTAPDPARPPASADAPAGFVAGIMTRQSRAGGQDQDLGVVVQSGYIRQTISQLDNPAILPP